MARALLALVCAFAALSSSTAALLGLPALGIVDRNSLAGAVRAHEAAKVTGTRFVLGCRLDLEEGTSLLVYPTDKPAYSRLTRLLSLGKGRAGKGACRLGWDDVEQVRADDRLRLGLRTTTLEIDAGAVLVVLSRRAIGADPAEAAALINAFRPR